MSEGGEHPAHRPPAPRRTSGHPPAPAAAPAAPLRVVVTDDNPVVRAGLTALLSGRPGIEVVAQAADGHEAHEAALRHRPDVILLDVRMPGVDGISALPRLVRLAPVLMMTYSQEAEIVREALRLGAGGYLVHGEFTADQLVAAVHDITAGRAPFTRTPSGALLAALRGAVDASAEPLPDGLGMLPVAQEPPPLQSALAHEADPREPSLLPTGPPSAGFRQVTATQQLPSESSLSQGYMGQSVRSAIVEGLSRREGEVMDLIASGMTNQQIAATCFISEKTVKNHINRIFAKLHAGSRSEAIARWLGTAPGSGVCHG
jgi:DNA-binding NarL/FixJ family response regulator